MLKNLEDGSFADATGIHMTCHRAVNNQRMPKEEGSQYPFGCLVALAVEDEEEMQQILDKTVSHWNEIGTDTSLFPHGSSVVIGDRIDEDLESRLLDQYVTDGECLKILMTLHQIEEARDIKTIPEKDLLEICSKYFLDSARGVQLVKNFASSRR